MCLSSLRALTTTTVAMHEVRIKPGTIPIKQKERRIAYQYREDFDKILDDLLESKKIQPSYSAWASPLRLLRKKDGSLRVTVDYQQVNNVTEKVAYPLPFIDEIFNRLSKAKYFTVMDLTSGYYQVPLEPKSRQYTAFICARGLFEYIVCASCCAASGTILSQNQTRKVQSGSSLNKVSQPHNQQRTNFPKPR